MISGYFGYQATVEKLKMRRNGFGIYVPWLFGAILYVYCIVMHIPEKHWHTAYILAFFAFIIAYGFQVINYMGHYHWSNIYWRNFLFFGFPMYSLGRFLHKIQTENQITNKILFIIWGRRTFVRC